MYLAEPRPRVSRSDPDFRRVYNLLQIDHHGLPSSPGATLSWAYGEFSDYDHHRPTDWPTAADDDLVDDVAAMTPRAYLEELHTVLSRLIAGSTDLAATLQHPRASWSTTPPTRSSRPTLNAPLPVGTTSPAT